MYKYLATQMLQFVTLSFRVFALEDRAEYIGARGCFHIFFRGKEIF